MSFMRLGMNIDNLLADIADFNRKMPWYKVYAYFYTKKCIKNNEFKSEQHFKDFMEWLQMYHLKEWQCRKLWELYKEGVNEQETTAKNTHK